MADRLKQVRLTVNGNCQCSLALRRVPVWLRFVRKPNPKSRCGRTAWIWDALDQLNDRPAAGEEVVVAKCMGSNSVHLDMVKNGRRVGVWELVYHYEAIADPPGDDVVRDNARWAEWAMAQQA